MRNKLRGEQTAESKTYMNGQRCHDFSLTCNKKKGELSLVMKTRKISSLQTYSSHNR